MAGHMRQNGAVEHRSVAARTASPAPGRAGRTTSRAAWAALLVVWVVWGSTFVAIRVGVESIPPLAMASVRYLIAGALLLPVARMTGGPALRVADRPGIRQWLGMSVVGTMLLAFGNGAACYAEQTLPAGFTALLIATVPFWMVLADRVINRRAVGWGGWPRPVGPRGAGRHAGPAARVRRGAPDPRRAGRQPQLGHRLGAGGSAARPGPPAARQLDGDADRRSGPGRPRRRHRRAVPVRSGTGQRAVVAGPGLPDRPWLAAGHDLLRDRAAPAADGGGLHLRLRQPGRRREPGRAAARRAPHA